MPGGLDGPPGIIIYTELDLLSFAQAEAGLARRYDRVEAVQRVQLIRRLQAGPWLEP